MRPPRGRLVKISASLESESGGHRLDSGQRRLFGESRMEFGGRLRRAHRGRRESAERDPRDDIQAAKEFRSELAQDRSRPVLDQSEGTGSRPTHGLVRVFHLFLLNPICLGLSNFWPFTFLDCLIP